MKHPVTASLILLAAFVLLMVIIANGPNKLFKINHETRTIALAPSQKFTYRLGGPSRLHVSSSDPVNVEGRACSGLQVLDYECETTGDVIIVDARPVLTVLLDRSIKMNAVKLDVRY